MSSSKTPKTLTGIETSDQYEQQLREARSKTPKTLTGIETLKSIPAEHQDFGFQNPQNPYRD